MMECKFKLGNLVTSVFRNDAVGLVLETTSEPRRGLGCFGVYVQWMGEYNDELCWHSEHNLILLN